MFHAMKLYGDFMKSEGDEKNRSLDNAATERRKWSFSVSCLRRSHCHSPENLFVNTKIKYRRGSHGEAVMVRQSWWDNHGETIMVKQSRWDNRGEAIMVRQSRAVGEKHWFHFSAVGRIFCVILALVIRHKTNVTISPRFKKKSKYKQMS